MARFLTVTPNPAVDVTYTVDRQEIGETLRVREVRKRPGGKGINVARVLRTLGRDVRTVHPLGGETGAWLERALRLDGLAATGSPIVGDTRTTVAVVDDIAHPTLLAEPGPALTAPEWSRLRSTVVTAAQKGDWVVIAGSFPPGTAPSDLDSLIRSVRATGARIVVDTSGPLLLSAARAGADVVKANEGEVRQAVGGGDLPDAMYELARHGAMVMVSRGSRGALLRLTDGELHEQRAVPGVRGNPTGAGDAATAGLVAALAEHHDGPTALTWAALCGAAAVLAPVAGDIDPAALIELASRIGPGADGIPLPLPPERSPS